MIKALSSNIAKCGFHLCPGVDDLKVNLNYFLNVQRQVWGGDKSRQTQNQKEGGGWNWNPLSIKITIRTELGDRWQISLVGPWQVVFLNINVLNMTKFLTGTGQTYIYIYILSKKQIRTTTTIMHYSGKQSLQNGRPQYTEAARSFRK